MMRGKEERSKWKFYLEGKNEWKPKVAAEYMKKLTRKQASTIFKARTRMLKVKCNYKNGYTDLTCRACKDEPETQNHILYECRNIHPEIPTSTTQPEQADNTDIFNENPDMIFTENPDKLRITAIKISEILDKLLK